MKANINLTKWSIFNYGDYLYLSGVADWHPKLGTKAIISHTSMIINITLNSPEEFICETNNSNYICNWKYVSLEKHGSLLAKVQNIPGHEVYNKYYDLMKYIVSGDCSDCDTNKEELDRLLELSALGKKELEEKSIREDKELIDYAKKFKNCVYMKLSTISRGDKLAYNIDGNVGIIKPKLHVGTFQDSVLYMEEGLVDFRYFPKGTGMEIYSWSDNIEKVVIKNMKNYDIQVDNQTIKAGETAEINHNNYNCGLVSPNCVDGSSILFRGQTNN